MSIWCSTLFILSFADESEGEPTHYSAEVMADKETHLCYGQSSAIEFGG